MKNIIKRIWNERLTNLGLWIELLLVFVAMWYVADTLFCIGKTYFEPLGYDIENTYYSQVVIKPQESTSFIPKENQTSTVGEDALTVVQKLRQLPEIEAISISVYAYPYCPSNSSKGFVYDTLQAKEILVKYVTPDFFQVFRYENIDGSSPSHLSELLSNDRQIIVSESVAKDFGFSNASEIIGKSLAVSYDTTDVYQVQAVTKNVRYNEYVHAFDDRYVAHLLTEKEIAKMSNDEVELMEICFRVRTGTSPEFANQLMQNASQFNVGNLFLGGIASLDHLRETTLRENVQETKSRIWIMVFLLVNIFLAIIGTFWFRTQQRRSELGLRLALGCSRKQLRRELLTEGWVLLTLAAIPAILINIHIGLTDLVYDFYYGFSPARFIIGTLITYLLMAVMIVVSIWYPARQAMRIAPAEALHEE